MAGKERVKELPTSATEVEKEGMNDCGRGAESLFLAWPCLIHVAHGGSFEVYKD